MCKERWSTIHFSALCPLLCTSTHSTGSVRHRPRSPCRQHREQRKKSEKPSVAHHQHIGTQALPLPDPGSPAASTRRPRAPKPLSSHPARAAAQQAPLRTALRAHALPPHPEAQPHNILLASARETSTHARLIRYLCPCHKPRHPPPRASPSQSTCSSGGGQTSLLRGTLTVD